MAHKADETWMWQSEALELSGPSRRHVVGEGVCRMGKESGGQGKSGSVCVAGPESSEAGRFLAPVLWCPGRGTPVRKST